MKSLSLIVITASILLGNAAWAGEPSYWDNPMPRGDGTGVPTTAQINWALKARGEPPLGSARVLEDNNAGVNSVHIHHHLAEPLAGHGHAN